MEACSPEGSWEAQGGPVCPDSQGMLQPSSSPRARMGSVLQCTRQPLQKGVSSHSPKSTPLRNAELDTLVFTLRLLMLEGGPRGCRGLWGWVGRGRGGS